MANASFLRMSIDRLGPATGGREDAAPGALLPPVSIAVLSSGDGGSESPCKGDGSSCSGRRSGKPAEPRGTCFGAMLADAQEAGALQSNEPGFKVLEHGTRNRTNSLKDL